MEKQGKFYIYRGNMEELIYETTSYTDAATFRRWMIAHHPNEVYTIVSDAPEAIH